MYMTTIWSANLHQLLIQDLKWKLNIKKVEVAKKYEERLKVKWANPRQNSWKKNHPLNFECKLQANALPLEMWKWKYDNCQWQW